MLYARQRKITWVPNTALMCKIKLSWHTSCRKYHNAWWMCTRVTFISQNQNRNYECILRTVHRSTRPSGVSPSQNSTSTSSASSGVSSAWRRLFIILGRIDKPRREGGCTVTIRSPRTWMIYKWLLVHAKFTPKSYHNHSNNIHNHAKIKPISYQNQ